MVALAVVSGLVCTVAVVFVGRHAGGDGSDRAIVEGFVIGVPMAAGLFAIGSLGDGRFGAILLATGYAWSVTALGESHDSLAYSIGRVAGWLVFPWLIYLMLAFPEGRVGRGLDRAVFRGLNVVLVVLFAGSALFVVAYPEFTPWATCRLHCPANAFLVVDSQPAAMHDVVQPLRETLTVLLFAGATASMARRWRAATPLRRRTVGPVMLIGGLSVLLLAAF